jgi:hypothetical protein
MDDAALTEEITRTVLKKVVTLLASDPRGLAEQLALLQRQFEVDDASMLQWILDGKFYQPQGLCNIARNQLKIENKDIIDFVKARRPAFTTKQWKEYKKFLNIQED